MPKKRKIPDMSSGFLPGDAVTCWSIVPFAIYEVVEIRPRVWETDLITLKRVATLSGFTSYYRDETLVLDAGHLQKVTTETVMLQLRKLHNDASVLLCALERQHALEKKRLEPEKTETSGG